MRYRVRWKRSDGSWGEWGKAAYLTSDSLAYFQDRADREGDCEIEAWHGEVI